MKHYNAKKDKRIKDFPKESIDTTFKTIKGLLSFSFKYIDSSQGQKLSELTKEQIDKLLEKLRWYSGENRQHWENERIGNNNGKVLTVYGDFPKKSDFYHPHFVPAGVQWARFRLEGDMRLIGFVINKTDVEKYDLNTDVFYIMFLDVYHKFFKS